MRSRYSSAGLVLVIAAISAFGFAASRSLVATGPRRGISVALASYATSLTGRTRAQRHNAELAAAALDGAVVAPGEVLSFNLRVRSWTHDRGYVRAPVSFGGELVSAFGGGVCQTSTTLYNAALLAGLEVVERHPHTNAPSYAAPGRDAAVAQETVDLRLRNPYPWPVIFRASAPVGSLKVTILGAERPATTVKIVSAVTRVERPRTFIRAGRVSADGAARRSSLKGLTGYRISTYRAIYRDGGLVSRTKLSDDSYEPAHRLVTASGTARLASAP